MIERRHERRTQTYVAVRVVARDVSGNQFAEDVIASSISRGGALLSGMTREVRPGDLIWVEYQNRKARFRVVWLGVSQSGQKTQAAVQRLENEECPWIALLKQD